MSVSGLDLKNIYVILGDSFFHFIMLTKNHPEFSDTIGSVV